MRLLTSEAKVGLFGLLAFLILLYMTITVGELSLFKEKGDVIIAYFNNVAGLDRKSIVRVSGVEVGKVESITLDKGKARVALRFDKKVILREDAIAYIKSESFLGEKYVEVSPGSPDKPVLKPGSIIKVGEGGADLDGLMEKFDGMAEDIRSVIKPLKEIFASEEGKEDFKGLFKNLNSAVKSLNETVFSDKEKLNRIVDNFDKMSEDFRFLGENTVPRLDRIAKKIESGEGTLGKLVNDDTLYNEAKKTLDNLRESVPKLKESLDNFYEISQKVGKGEGSLAKLINDETLYNETKDAIENLNTITKKIIKGEGTIGKLYTDDSLYVEARNALKKLNRTAEGMEEQAPVSVLGVMLGFLF
ncbi:MAG TPA: MlaD family protein [Nitrospinota bacterium]|nr:MlaD family protein [Nitrospinota bacterium]